MVRLALDEMGDAHKSHVGAADPDAPVVVVVSGLRLIRQGDEFTALQGDGAVFDGIRPGGGHLRELPDKGSRPVQRAIPVHQHQVRGGGAVVLVGTPADEVSHPVVFYNEHNRRLEGATYLPRTRPKRPREGHIVWGTVTLHQEDLATAVLELKHGVVDDEPRPRKIRVRLDDGGLPAVSDIVDGSAPGLHGKPLRVGVGMGLDDGGEVVGTSVTPRAKFFVRDKPLPCHQDDGGQKAQEQSAKQGALVHRADWKGEDMAEEEGTRKHG